VPHGGGAGFLIEMGGIIEGEIVFECESTGVRPDCRGQWFGSDRFVRHDRFDGWRHWFFAFRRGIVSPEIVAPTVAAGEFRLAHQNFGIGGQSSFRVCAPAVSRELRILEKTASSTAALLACHA
jgi:hypothetical protein